MITCSGCGQENPNGASYCVHCGTAMEVASRRVDVQTAPVAAGGPETRTSGVLLETLRQATLGEYEVLGELGRGGMAFVYLAHDISLDRRVAIKVISPSLLWADEGIAERFKREARTAAALSHPHIIPIYAVRESENILYFVMKYVPGRTLESVIDELGRLPFAMVQTILSQVGNALGYAHRRGVVHRDVKPGNIMLDEEGWAVVTDFGIAKVAAAEGLTQTGGTVGTPAYMSPEQCSGLPVEGASDQYSLGVVAYEMVTGRKPFEGKSAMGIMYQHCNTMPAHVRDLVPDCPPELATAIMQMLEKEAETRWRAMEDMVASIGFISAAESDAVRTQMVTLVQNSDARRLIEKFTTPSSPVPRGRPSSRAVPAGPTTSRPSAPTVRTSGTLRAARRSRKRLLMMALPVILVAATVAIWRPWAGSAEPDAAATPVTPSEPAEPAPVPVSVQVIPTAPQLVVGESVPLTATVRDGAGNPIDAAVSWMSTNDVVATVSGTGVVTAVAPGRVNVRASSGDALAGAEVTVEAPTAAPSQPSRPPARVASVSVSARSLALTVGASERLSATPRDQAGSGLSGRTVRWSSDDAGVATVTAQGLVSAVGEGETTIRATSDGRAGTVAITVRPVAAASVAVSPAQQTLEVGGSVTLSAVPRDAQGNALPDRPVSWSSSAPSVVRVTADGVATARAAGTASVSATSGAASGAATITVRAPADPPPAQPVDHRPAIEQTLQAYGAAIEARDLDAIRRVFPDIPERQAQAWRDFFRLASDIDVTVTPLAVQVDGAGSTADIRLRLQFRATGQSRNTEEPQTITLALRGTTWRITNVQ